MNKRKTKKQMKKKAEGENGDGEKQVPAGTIDAPTCTFSTFKHFYTLFKHL